MKKVISMLLCALMVLPLAVSCGSSGPSEESGTDTGTTTTPTVQSASSTELEIVKDGKTTYSIVYKNKTNDKEKAMAEYLQETLETLTGAKLNLIADSSAAVANEIVVGTTARDMNVDKSVLEKNEAFLIRVIGTKIVIMGGTSAGTERGVRYFTQNYVDENGNVTVSSDLDLLKGNDPKVKNVTIAGNALSEYVIRIPADAGGNVVYAAEQLQSYLEKATDVSLEIVRGETDAARLIDLKADPDGKLGTDGFRLAVESGNLNIYGGSERGHMNGVFELLEAYIGWCFPTTNVEYIFESDKVEFAEGFSDEQIPVFAMRDITSVSLAGVGQIDWMTQNKINANSYYAAPGGAAVHTIADLAGTDRGVQPCLTSESIYQTVKANIVAGLGAPNDNTHVVAVNQMDHSNVCNCGDCYKVLQEEGAYSGGWIRFLNRLLAELKPDYPNLYLQTLAYGYTNEPPKLTKPDSNVVIQYAPWWSYCYKHAFSNRSCADNTVVQRQLDEWVRIANRVWIYDYSLNVSDLISPYMNFDVLRANAQYFASRGVERYYVQGQINGTRTTGFESLCQYLIAKVLWNPYMTDEEFEEYINEFFIAYYGPGGVYLEEYFTILLDGYHNMAVDHIYPHSFPFEMVRIIDYINYGDQIEEWFDLAKLKAETSDQVTRIDLEKLSFTWMKLSAEYDYVYTWGDTETRKQYEEEVTDMYRSMQMKGITPGEGWSIGGTFRLDYPPTMWTWAYSNDPER